MSTNTETSTTDAPPILETPYPDLKYGSGHRQTIDLPREDVNRIRTVKMDKGALYFALQHFTKCLANECRRNKWTLANEHEFTNFILERCRGADDQFDAADNRLPQGGRDDSGRQPTPGVRQGSESTEDQRPTRQRKQATTRKQASGVGGSHDNTAG